MRISCQLEKFTAVELIVSNSKTKERLLQIHHAVGLLKAPMLVPQFHQVEDLQLVLNSQRPSSAVLVFPIRHLTNRPNRKLCAQLN